MNFQLLMLAFTTSIPFSFAAALAGALSHYAASADAAPEGGEVAIFGGIA